MNSVVLSGKIDENGKLKIPHDEGYENFLSLNKGKVVAIRLNTVSPRDKSLQIWYFENVVLPQFRDGLIQMGYNYNNELVRDFIRANYPRWEDDEELQDVSFWADVMEWCKQYAALNFNTYISDNYKR